MRGKIVSESERLATRKIWAETVVPALMDSEIRPIEPLLHGQSALVALDVGANKGYWAKGFLRVFGPAVQHVYLVEPSPENCSELSRRADNLMFDAGDFEKLSVRQAAMGASAGTATLYTNEDGSPLASLYPHPLNGYASGELADIDLSVTLDVPMTTVDRFLAEVGCDHIDVMKIDVEGHELDVLFGAQQTLSRSLVDMISLEFGIHQVESRHFFKDFYTFLSDFGFKLYFIRGTALEPVERYEYKFEDFSTNFQLVGHRLRSPAPSATRDHQSMKSEKISLADVAHFRNAAQISARERDLCKAALETLQGEHAAVVAAHALALKSLQRSFEQSSSWRVTRPLRGLARSLRRLSGKR